MNDLAVRIMFAPANERFLRVEGTCLSFLYVLRPPASVSNNALRSARDHAFGGVQRY